MDKKEVINYAVNELICAGNTAAIQTAFTENYVAHAGDKTYKGHDFLQSWAKQVRAAIDNIGVKKILFLAENGPAITWLRILTGIHKKNLRGIPASGKKIIWTEMVVSRFENEKICEEWVVSELAGELFAKQPKK